MNTLFCDGSVHFLSETIESIRHTSCGGSNAVGPALFPYLYDRKDGNPVSGF
jgi:hypothetical protein